MRPDGAAREFLLDPGLVADRRVGHHRGAVLEQGLLDELRLWVHPLFVGQASSADLLFRPSATAQFELTDTLALNTGTVILTYRVPADR